MGARCSQTTIHGQSKRYVHTRIGLGGRMDTLQCGIVLAKWPRFAWEVAQREQLGERYTRLILDTVPGAAPVTAGDTGKPLTHIRTLAVRAGNTSVHAQYTVLVPDRDALQAKLQAAGIPTAVHYPVPLNVQPAYAHLCCPECTPVAGWLASHVMSLPMGPDLGDDQDVVVSALRACLLA